MILEKWVKFNNEEFHRNKYKPDFLQGFFTQFLESIEKDVPEQEEYLFKLSMEFKE